MHNKNCFLSLFIITALLLSGASLSSQKYKVGLSVWSDYPASVNGFKEAMAKNGFIEGKNVQYVLRNAKSNAKAQQKIASQFSNTHFDLIYSLTTPGTVIIKKSLNSQIPIVFSIVTYPADAGLIESFDYSGNNLVGTSNYVALRHYVELLSTLLPNTKSVAIFHRKFEPNSKMQTINLTRLLKRKGIKVIVKQPQNVAQVMTMGQSLVGKVDVFITTTDTLMQSGGEQALIELSKQFNIPILSSNKQGIENGATFGPVADFYVLGKLSGTMAAKILLGTATPSKLHSQYQTQLSIIINMQRINALGINVPSTLKGAIYVN